jgi:hypothetical protein
MHRAPALLLIASSLTLGLRASAAPADGPIAVSVAECPSALLGPEPFLSSLRVELAGEGRACCTRLNDPAAPAGPVAAAVDPCGATPSLVQVHVRDDRSGAALDRQVPLADVSPDARPRALALAVAELIRTAASTPAAVVSTAPPAEAAEAVDGWIPLLGLAVRTHPTGDVTLVGFHAGIELARGAWQAALGAQIESGSPSVSLGKVDTTFAGGSLELGRRLLFGAKALDLGALIGLGIVHLDGVPGSPGTIAGSGSGLEVTAGARAAFDFWRIPHDRAHLRLVLEGGGALRSVEATVNGQSAAGMTGAYLLAGLAASLGPF